MIPPFERALIHKYAVLSAFPVTGEAEHFYLADDTNTLYRWKGGAYVAVGGTGSSGGGHTVIDSAGVAMPQRAKLQFLNSDLMDDGPGDTTLVDVTAYDKPYQPLIHSPADGAVDVPTAVRIQGSAYHHPYNFPMAESHWQIATDVGFTSLVLDRLQENAAQSTIITVDASLAAILSPSTQYYARVSYIDLRGRVSSWSGTVSFTTAAAVSTNAILAPEIIAPVDNGYMPEHKLLVRLSSPEVIGSVVPDKSDVQVSITDAFAPIDIVVDKQDVTDPVLIMDDAVDLSAAPSPLYIRGRQKDSGQSVISPWSHAPTVWLQRSFRELTIGRMTIVKGGNSVSRWIDKNGAIVNVESGYWDAHPLWGGIQPETYNAPNAASYDCYRIPAFYVNAETTENGDEITHKIWVSPLPFDGGVGYLHPAFVLSPAGILVSKYLDANAAGTTGTPVTATVANWRTYINNVNNGGVVKARPFNIHARNALLLLASIEISSNNMQLAPNTYRGIEYVNGAPTAAPALCDGFTLTGTYGSWTGDDAAPKLGTLKIGNPAVPTDYFVVGNLTGTNRPSSGFGYTYYVNKIFTGFSNEIGAHLELYEIPKDCVRDTVQSNNYRAQFTYQWDIPGSNPDMVATAGSSNVAAFGPLLGRFTAGEIVYARMIVLD